MNVSELEFNKRKMLLEQIIDNCYSEMEKYKFTILNDTTVTDLNIKIQESCSSFDDKYTKFIFNPLSKDEIENGKADFKSHFKIDYHSIDTANLSKGASIDTWLSVL